MFKLADYCYLMAKLYELFKSIRHFAEIYEKLLIFNESFNLINLLLFTYFRQMQHYKLFTLN